MIDSKLCPFCKKENKCQVDTPNSCWCRKIVIPNGLKELVPKKYKMKACICEECVSLFLNNKEKFLQKYCKNH